MHKLAFIIDEYINNRECLEAKLRLESCDEFGRDKKGSRGS